MTGARRFRDDTGSLPLAVLLTIVLAGLTVALAQVLGVQQREARNDLHRAGSINAAQSGVEAALGQFRAAVSSTDPTAGDPARLPCAPVTGPVTGAGGASYRVTVQYLSAAPPAGDAGWAAANALACVPGAGPAAAPGYAFISSTGWAAPGATGRTVYATYTFQSRMRGNVAGGLVHVYWRTPLDLCFAAPGPQPSSGAALTMRECDPAAEEQQFAYEPDLTLALVSSRADGSAGMCLDATPADGSPVQFRPCVTPAAPRQQWSLNDRGSFEGTTDGAALNRMCFNIVTPGSEGSAVVLGDAQVDGDHCGGDYTAKKTFAPDAAVGTGRAGATTGQLVNYHQFGRCLDVTADSVDAEFLVVWPCKQKPSGAIQWNQVWDLPDIPADATAATGRVSTTTPEGVAYCLRRPASTAPPAHVVLDPCPAGGATQADMLWIRTGDTGVYADSYRIASAYDGGQSCLAAADQDAPSPDLWGEGPDRIAKLQLVACGSDLLQKWNARPDLMVAGLKDLGER